MVYAYKCGRKFHYIEMNKPRKTVNCTCGKRHELELTDFEDGHAPNINTTPPDIITGNGFDLATGQTFDTITERKRYYKKHGFNRQSQKDWAKQNSL